MGYSISVLSNSGASAYPHTCGTTTPPADRLTFTAATGTDANRASIGETNATVVIKINKPSGTAVTKCGIQLMDAEGVLIKQKEETPASGTKSMTFFHAWYDINAELGVTLTPGTAYKYRFFAVCGGSSYNSSVYSFVTLGAPPAPPKPTNLTIKTDKTSYAVGETVAITLSSQGATHHRIGIARNGSHIHSDAVESVTVYYYTPTRSGSYDAYFSAFNGDVFSDSGKVPFSVTEPESQPASEPPITPPSAPSPPPAQPSPPVPKPKSWQDNFRKIKDFYSFTFGDVPYDAWYYANVEKACQLGLMKGGADGTFTPDANITMAEAVALAARIHSIYHTGRADAVPNAPSPSCRCGCPAVRTRN